MLRLFPPPIGEGGSLPASWIDIAGEWVLGDLAPHRRGAAAAARRGVRREGGRRAGRAPPGQHRAGLVRRRERQRRRAGAHGVDHLRQGARTSPSPPAGRPATARRCSPGSTSCARWPASTPATRPTRASTSRPPSTASASGCPTPAGATRAARRRTWWPVGCATCSCPTRTRTRSSGAATWPGSATRPTTRTTRPIGETIAPGKVELFIGEPVDWLPIYDARGPVLEQGWEQLAPLLADDREVAELLGDRPEPAAEPGAAAPGDDRGGPAARRGDAGPRRHHPRDAPPRPPRPAPHAPRAGGVARPRAPQRRARERVAGARHLRAVVRVRARRPAAPDPEGPGPPPHRHRPTRCPTRLSSGPPPLSPDDAARAWLATDWLIRVQAAVVAPAGRPHRGRRPPRVDRTHQQPPRPGALGRRARLGDHDRRPPHRPHRVDRRRRARRRQRPRGAGGVGGVGAGVGGGRLGRRVGGGVGGRARRARLRHRPPGDRVRARRPRARRARGRPALDRRHRVGHRPPLGGRRGVDGRLGRRPPRGRRAGACCRCAPPPTAPSAPRSNRAGADDDAREASLDAAESAAKERLTRAALGTESWGSDTHPWDAAFEAAATHPGGQPLGRRCRR